MWVVLGVIGVAIVLSALLSGGKSSDIAYNEFIQKVQAGQVKELVVQNDSSRITGKTIDGKEFSTTAPVNGLPEGDLDARAREGPPGRSSSSRPAPTSSAACWCGCCRSACSIGFWWWLGRRQQGQMAGLMSIGRSKAKVYTTEKPKTTFADVAGYNGVKQEITEVVDFLKQPGKFKEIGARIPKGVLLVGPPGTGKTLIARAVAGEAGVPFMSVTGSDFMEMFVGVGAARVRDLFQTRAQAGAVRSSSSTRSTRSAASAAPGSAAGTTSGSRRSTRCSRRWTASRPPRAS